MGETRMEIRVDTHLWGSDISTSDRNNFRTIVSKCDIAIRSRMRRGRGLLDSRPTVLDPSGSRGEISEELGKTLENRHLGPAYGIIHHVHIPCFSFPFLLSNPRVPSTPHRHISSKAVRISLVPEDSDILFLDSFGRKVDLLGYGRYSQWNMSN
jgi:hypothetical protein